MNLPRLVDIPDSVLTTSHTDEAVVVSLPTSVQVLVFTPAQARRLASLLLEQAQQVDHGAGWN